MSVPVITRPSAASLGSLSHGGIPAKNLTRSPRCMACPLNALPPDSASGSVACRGTSTGVGRRRSSTRTTSLSFSRRATLSWRRHTRAM